MQFTDILKKEIPITKKLYQELGRYRGKELQEVPSAAQRELRRLKTVPSVTASGLEKVDSLRILLAATHVIAQEALQDEAIKPTNSIKTSKPLQKK